MLRLGDPAREFMIKAHTKFDPLTGEWLLFGMTPGGQKPMQGGKTFHMPGLPKPPKLPGSKGFGLSARGGAEGAGKPTDIVAAGGEFIIPPEAIIRKFGDLERGHKILDKWVMDTRKKHIKTLRGLKPPKKD